MPLFRPSHAFCVSNCAYMQFWYLQLEYLRRLLSIHECFPSLSLCSFQLPHVVFDLDVSALAVEFLVNQGSPDFAYIIAVFTP